MKNDRIFPNFDIQVGQRKKLVCVKLYTGNDTIQSVFAWLTGKAAAALLMARRSSTTSIPLNQETVNLLSKTVISEFKNQKEGVLVKAESIRSKMDVHLYRPIGLEKSRYSLYVECSRTFEE
ncbi:hypothetical protein ACTFIR_012922 [Dictyostelium discoideum]